MVEIVVSEKFRLFDLMLRCASDGDACPTRKGLHPGQDRIFGSFPCPRLGANRMTGGLMLLAMLLIELKGGWSELCNSDWAGNVGVDTGETAGRLDTTRGNDGEHAPKRLYSTCLRV